ncbi:efflux RND transporter periplasmic adaptor subunit [Polaromonas naphthalenivorans]|uniref:Efflux transporter, RND family, MFP subunit n=1 Tax=Polaromonas naphthalenivorans (strain CJ2) TaxID=365044 RepID=A1VIC8_POLNA|nr:efflux RND transporter periplasmic adaptor subunit [Polaromonas naphthalenivorans]ABM35406.1 efflux transporter, RND family, MFP subunit [Polaromonas naphthalenivorans CJ2]
MKPLFKWGVGALLVLAVAGAAVLASRRGTPVQLVPVARTGIVQSVVATGRLNAPARMDIGAEVTATVLEVRVREGDRVRAGALLLRLSDAEARAALQQASAALVEARGRATQQATVAAPVAGQAVVQAEAAFTSAERDFQRARELVAQGFFSQQKLDDARRALDTARSALQSARVQAQANQPSGVERTLAASRVDQALAAVDIAQARLARLSIASPVDAIVLTRSVEPGSMAQPGHVLLTLAAQGGTRIDANVDEKNLRLLTPGMPAKAVADAYPGQSFDAQLNYIAPAVDPQRGTVEVRLAVPNPPPFLRPDMTVSVELVGGLKKDALVLPSGAVRDADREAPWVLALQDGLAVRVPVKLGLRGVGSIEITEGLKEGDAIIPQTEKAIAGDRVRPGPVVAPVKGMETPSFISR